ncbi:MAG: type II toxin-antitoxin system VapC family toxin [Bryobacteraceae bacterium]
MVIDTSALVAILLDEPERRRFNQAIESSARRLISAATVLEAAMVLEGRFGAPGGRLLDRFLLRARFESIPVDAEQAGIARRAFRKYGKGRHRAGLNYGDCFSYALAKAAGEPLLYKGSDFAQTDVEPAG